MEKKSNRKLQFVVILLIYCTLIVVQALWILRVVQSTQQYSKREVDADLTSSIDAWRKQNANILSTNLERLLLDSLSTTISINLDSNQRRVVTLVCDRKKPEQEVCQRFVWPWFGAVTQNSFSTKRNVVKEICKSIGGSFFIYNPQAFYVTESITDSLKRIQALLQADTAGFRSIFQRQMHLRGLFGVTDLHFLQTSQPERKLHDKQIRENSIALSSVYLFAQNTYVYVSGKPASVWSLNLIILIVAASFLVIVITVGLILFFYSFTKEKELSKIKNEFIDNVTHELKTPLAAIMASAEGLQRFDLIAKPHLADRLTNHILSQAGLLNNHISKILEISTLSKGFFLNKQEFLLKPFLFDILYATEINHSKKFSFTLSGDDCLIYADKYHLTNVFTNLLDNAVKYNHHEVCEVTVTMVLSERIVRIMLTDNGIGMSEDEKARAFEKFYRVEQTLHIRKGFGLGLYYAKTVIDQHKGTIELHSIKNSGTEITVVLPCKGNDAGV